MPLYATKLTVVTEDWPPYNYHDKQGNVVGASTENVKKVLALSGLDYDLKLYPWARAYDMALSKKNVLIYTIIKTPSREPLFHWFCPIHAQVKIYFYKLANNETVQLKTVADAKKYRVGVARGDWNEAFLKEEGFDVGVNLDIAATDDANLQTLLAGRIDLMLNSEHAMRGRLKKINASYDTVKKALLQNVKREDPSCMALSLNSDPIIVEGLQKAFEQYLQVKEIAQ